MAKITVVGAGAVGSSTAYALMIQGVAREVVLYDIDEARARAEVLDLAHGSPFTPATELSGGSDMAETAGSDLVIITAGAKQRPGQSRLDLAGVNVSILEALIPKLLGYSPDAILMLVTNPCDVLAVVAQKISGLPSSRVFSSGTVLDSSRLRWMLSKRLSVAASSVHAYILGEHGDSEFALWSQTRIGAIPLSSWELADGELLSGEELESIAFNVKNAAYQVIEGKGATNYAIGLSAARIASAVLSDENAVLTVSSLLHDYMGISGVALSVPSIVNRSGVARVLEFPMSLEEREKFEKSAAAVANSLASLGF
ncbi:MAG: hypothetical protein RLZ65_35 [Actinomycetota bacterium]|jgi:L-lactate dehydrogenase